MYRATYEGGLKLPELGALDRAIYAILVSVTMLGTVGAFAAFWILFNKLPMMDPAVAGVDHTLSIFGILIFVILMGLVISALIHGWMCRFPIFGTAGVTYGAPEWTPVFPLLMPTREAPEQVKRDVREGRQIVLMMAAGVLLSAFVFATSMFSGNLLNRDGSVRVLWGPGWEMLHYQPEDVAEVTVELDRSGSGRRSMSTPKWYIRLSYRMDDDRLYSFQVTDAEFRKDEDQSQVELLARILDNYTEAKVTFVNGGRISAVIRDQQYSMEDQLIMEELFGVK